MNKVILIGRVATDIEVKTSSGNAYAKFNVAVSRMKAEDGADFLPCVAFGKTAELIEKYVPKGRQIALEGHWQTGSYEKDGKKFYTNEMIVERMDFIGSEKTEKPKEDTSGFAKLDSSDIPF